jgi:transcription antitermination factor NusA-like protein
VIVPDYQLSLAIGKEGQNARLAARLTGWRIDIRSDAAAPEPEAADAPDAPAAGAAAEPSADAPSADAPSADAAGASAGAAARAVSRARSVPRQGRDAQVGAVGDNAGKA